MRKMALTAGALASLLVFAPLSASAYQSGDQQQVKLSKGTWWGKVGDRVEVEYKEGISTKKITGTITKIESGIITVEGQLEGKKVTRPIFSQQVQSMKTLDGKAAEAAPEGETTAKDGQKTATPPTQGTNNTTTTPPGTSPKKKLKGAGQVGVLDTLPTKTSAADNRAGVGSGKATGVKDAQGYDLDDQGHRVSPKRGVFVLPFEEGVGQEARAYEIQAMGLEADKWGPGQIIVMEIDSPGGLVTEIYKIIEAMREVRKNHRVVAWVKKGISAAACTSMLCDEIYFRTVGALGATTMIAGGDSIQGPELRKFMDEIGNEVVWNGRPTAVVHAMIKADRILTYTKDRVTGKPTFHDHITGLPGEVVLSDEKDNLVLNASNALDCGFSKGTADTNEELAKLMGLPEWYEISDYGRKMQKAWVTLFKACEADVAKLKNRMNIGRGSAKETLTSRLQTLETLLNWTKRCKTCTELNGVDPDQLKKLIEDTREQLAAIRKAEDANRRGS